MPRNGSIVTIENPVLMAINRLHFVFARTLENNVSRGGPHEYTVRKTALDDADYVALYDAIMRRGVLERWKGKPQRVLYPGDGWRYWSMSAFRNDKEGRHPLEISRHINRNREAEAQKLRDTGLISTY